MPIGSPELVEKVALANRILGSLDLTHEALGHVSCRLEGTDTMLIKGKGPGEAGLRYTDTRDVIRVDFNADKLDGPDDLQPPSESFLHIWMYKTRPEVQSVVHVHPEHAVLLTICEKPILPIFGAFASGARLAMQGIPVYPRSITIHDDELGQDFAATMGNKPVCLMRGHGITTVGNCVEQSTLHAIHLEQLCTMMYKAYLLGNPKPIPDQDIEETSGRLGASGRTRGSAGGTEGMMATWRYYVRLTEERTARREPVESTAGLRA